jgi:fructose/tagatose bisphosphate aldolase
MLGTNYRHSNILLLYVLAHLPPNTIILLLSSSTCNAVLEAARKNNCPVIIQVSNGGGAFVCGKGIKDPSAAAIGSVALAMHVRSVAKLYGVPVVLHSDHCAKVSVNYVGLLFIIS